MTTAVQAAEATVSLVTQEQQVATLGVTGGQDRGGKRVALCHRGCSSCYSAVEKMGASGHCGFNVPSCLFQVTPAVEGL